jgi:transcriptional regulator with XRE-family HTH domain
MTNSPTMKRPPASLLSHHANAHGSELGSSVRQRRHELGLTLEQLADRSGVSRATISKVERGDVTPTTVVLGKLAESLDISISQAIGGRKLQRSLRIPVSQQPVFSEPGSGFWRRSLSPLYQGKGLDVVLNGLPPHAQTGPFPSHKPGVEEHLYVIKGHLRLKLGDETYDLSAGDYMFYEADLPHLFSNPTNEPVEYFIVIDSTKLRGQR